MGAEPTRLQVGCGLLFLFDLIAVGVLAYLALGAGMVVPMECFRDAACEAARHSAVGFVAIAFWVTVAINAGFVVWAVRNHSRPIQ